MKNYFLQYKGFFVFLLKFFAVYGIFTFCYHYYLSGFDLLSNEPDGLTKSVAHQVEWFLQFFGNNAYVLPHEHEASMKLYYNEKFVARVVEGCNAVSVMILFAAFIVAFKGKIKHTLLFLVGGVAIIHVLNVIRIGLLAMALFHYPEQEHLLHGVIFPLFIYGVVFGLWVIWVQNFSTNGKAS